MNYAGDFAINDTIDIKFSTRQFSDGAPTVLTGTPVVVAYPDNSTTEITAGITLTASFDTRAGLNNVRIVATTGNGYAAGTNYVLVISAGTVGGTSVVGEVVGSFSLDNRSSLRPTTAGRTLDVTAAGEAGIDLDNTSGTLDAAQIGADSVTKLRSLVSDTADSGTTTTLVDAARTEADTDYWKGCWLLITSGTAANQIRLITGFTPGTDTITFTPALTQAVSTNTYEILPAGAIDLRMVLGVVQTVDLDTIDTNVNTVQAAVDSLNDPSNASIADTVWDEILTGGTHNIANSSGRRLRTLQESGGVYGGQIYIDTVNGTAGITDYENGTSDNHVLTLADAKTISASIEIPDFHIINGSSITLAESTVNESYFGDNWSLAFGAQVISGVHIEGASISGIGTATSEVSFLRCHFGTASIQLGHFTSCSFADTVTLTLAGDYNFHDCYSEGATPPIFEKTAGQAIVAEFHGWSGAITISGLEAGDTYELGGSYREIVLNGVDGTVHIHGLYDSITDNRTGSPVLTITGAIKAGDVATTLADTNDLQTRTPAVLVGGRMSSDVGSVDGSVTAASKMKDAMDATVQVTVDDTAFTPTATQFETNVTEATANHFKDRVIIFLSGTLIGQAKDITAYSLVGGRGLFTVSALTEAPLDTDTFLIV